MMQAAAAAAADTAAAAAEAAADRLCVLMIFDALSPAVGHPGGSAKNRSVHSRITHLNTQTLNPKPKTLNPKP